MTDDGTGLLTIGELARATGLSVRTIRYWSDEGALPPATRSAGGYRLYDAGSFARLELVRTLRELGLGLTDVRRVLTGETTVAQVAAAHVAALDARNRLRFAAADLPDDPTPEQVDAWVELVELIQEPEFRAAMRRMIEFNAADRGPDVPTGSSLWFMSRLIRSAGDALRDGVEPGTPRAAAVLRDLIGDADPAAVLKRLQAVADPRLNRYRELSAVVNGWDRPSARTEEFGWVVAALESQVAP
ncbi:MerR family transcriptional regulator [Streptomyces albogriseolus]|uniref:MerR family transcriptional regulator n=1 Tax=Streptomyces albogriseolus TaxID=1887 RepID=UPI0036F056C6